jgi:magnesium transporter
VSITSLLSTGNGEDEAVDLRSWGSRRLRDDELLWVDVTAPDADEASLVRSTLRLSDRAAAALEVEDAAADAAVHDDAIEVVVIALSGEADPEPIPLRILTGGGWVITAHPRPIAFLDEHREEIQDQREVGRITSVEFLAAVLDWHIKSFFEAARQLEDEVDRLDEAALRDLGSSRDLLARMVAMRRRIARVRRILAPHREVLSEIIGPDFLPEGDRHAADAFAMVATRLDRATDAVAHAREMLIGTFDIHMTRTAQRTNDTMRLLTLASVVLLPSVVLAGIMGMNFRVPLFEQPNLFYLVIGIMVVMAIATLAVARWRRWL